MDTEIIIGIVVAVCAIGSISYLAWWSRRTINRIAEGDPRSARDIVRELNDRD